MKKIVNRRLLMVLLLSLGAADVYSDADHSKSCGFFAGRLSDLNLQRPQRVLLIPLLSKDPHSTESPRWSEQPARTLKAFYRNQFHADVTVLRDLWSWPDYYREVEQVAEQAPPFDRVVFISHGGFDGPVLKNAVFWQKLEITGNTGKLLQLSEAQPGLENAMSITYDTRKNTVFSDYMATRWPEMAPMKSSDTFHLLKGLEKQLQPLDHACYARYCAPERLASQPERLRPYLLDSCELICREPLFEQKTAAEISEERFFRFTKSLASLTKENGLIFFGACNPGSAASMKTREHDETELLINSTIAGGPHRSYVHLVSAATGRIAAGPIGQSSADDIINRVTLFENNRAQRNLCIASPSAR
ncbi:hypothetical protein [Methylomicrobium lacus]|uniref:hypothetical protein n=1 Tax=Methylomicrobium lacus TaxID=136992 RepID=UPI00045E75F0|nr:hypothetical protein [Methylomicrobium lacus]